MNQIEQRTKRTEWFRHDRFGMFIHWGLYAIPARGEWVRSVEKISAEAYQPYFDAFDPEAYDPRQWAKTAKAAGMKYAVMTAKHHDGFCLYDSKLTDYKATNTKAGRDLIQEYLDAFRAEGLKVGIYYSLFDWHHPDYPAYGDRHHPMRDNEAWKTKPHNLSRYLDYMHGQVRELCTNYGKLDLLWFDFAYDHMTGEAWRGSELMAMIRQLQPTVLVDNRLEASGEGYGTVLDAEPSSSSGDFASPEQIIPNAGLRNVLGDPVPWEACITLNNNWGFHAADPYWKSSAQIIRKLVECVSKGGNLLLNVGPDATGRIPPESLRILAEVGVWMDKNKASISGCGASDLPKPDWGRFTQKGSTVYAHILEAPVGPLCLPDLAGRVGLVRAVATGHEVKQADTWSTKSHAQHAFLTFGPVPHETYPLPDDVDTVVEFELRPVTTQMSQTS